MVGLLRLVVSSPPGTVAVPARKSAAFKLKILPDLELQFVRGGASAGDSEQLTAMIKEDKKGLSVGSAAASASCPDQGMLVIGGFAAMCLYIHAAFCRADGTDFRISSLNSVILPLHFRAGCTLQAMYMCFNNGERLSLLCSCYGPGGQAMVVLQ